MPAKEDLVLECQQYHHHQYASCSIASSHNKETKFEHNSNMCLPLKINGANGRLIIIYLKWSCHEGCLFPMGWKLDINTWLVHKMHHVQWFNYVFIVFIQHIMNESSLSLWATKVRQPPLFSSFQCFNGRVCVTCESVRAAPPLPGMTSPWVAHNAAQKAPQIYVPTLSIFEALDGKSIVRATKSTTSTTAKPLVLIYTLPGCTLWFSLHKSQ